MRSISYFRNTNLRRGKSPRKLDRQRQRKLFVEQLEDRRLLATVDFSGAALTFNATAGIANVITVSVDGTGIDYTISSGGESITAVNALPAGCSVGSVPAVSVMLDCTLVGDITALTINADDLDDRINLVSIADSITVDGGTGSDQLFGSTASDAYTVTGSANAGTGTVDGDPLAFSDIGSINGDAGDDTFTFAASLTGTATGGDGDDTFNVNVNVAGNDRRRQWHRNQR